MRIVITNEQDFISIQEEKIRQAIHMLPDAKEKKYRLSIVYLNDAEIAKLNERDLHHEGPTDVLAYPLEKTEGEIYVSAETALREATERNIEPEGELILYTIHGTLHLLGYDDLTDEEFKEMHSIEKKVLLELGYTWNWDEEIENRHDID